jgi:exportin-5
MYQTESVNLLRKLYEWSIVDASRIDESKYAVSKKLSEVGVNPYFELVR